MLLSCRFFPGPVNLTEGWCPGSKAAYFSQLDSYATVPNINITNCDFTIAFWIKSTGFEGPLIAFWSLNGKLFYVAIKKSVVFLSVYNTLEKSFVHLKNWNHIAVTCEQFKIKVFVNGTKQFLQEQWNEYFFSSSEHYEPDFVIGNNPVLFTMPLNKGPFVGSIMDLHVVGVSLTENDISNLFKGKIELVMNSVKN